MKNAVLLVLSFFFSHLLAGQQQPVSVRTVPRNWFEKDPDQDSIAGISLDKAYTLLKGRKSTTVIVAVIDNGVDIDHVALKAVIWTNPGEVPGNGLDDDHNGYTDDVHGWNFRGKADGTVVENEQAGALQWYKKWSGGNPDSDMINLLLYRRAKKELSEKAGSKDSADQLFVYNPNYSSAALIAGDSEGSTNGFYGSPRFILSSNLSHGTHVAGIIAAQPNNGMHGIADNVRIMPILATTALGDERDKDIANAIRYAVDNGARIINMSFSKWYSPDKELVDEAIHYAEKKNVLIVHAAGNDGVDIDSAQNYHYPIAIYADGSRAENFITVGWSRPLFDIHLAHPFSNYGNENVDLFAPGSDIYSTVPGNGYDFKSGSSMAAPVVTGVAALLLSYFPQLTAGQVKMILMESAFRPQQMVNRPQTKSPVPFSSLSVSGGIVNAYSAVRMAIGLTEK